MTTSKPRSLPLMFFSRLTASTPSSSLPPNCDRRIGAAEGRTQMRRCGSFGGASRNRSISSLGSPADEILMTWREAGPEARMTWGSRPYRHSREVVNLRRSDENGPDWLAPANRRCVCVSSTSPDPGKVVLGFEPLSSLRIGLRCFAAAA